ncbi:porin [Inhella sp.]|uniref:porin n=1 Tax=Inhella sp. TaxID=1921806 RepID=UPI0035B12BCB
MKKSAFALCTLAAAMAPVWAQSSVTIYGVLDAGVSRTTGLLGGDKTHVISGIMDGSRLGIRVNEDIGGGWRALAVLENRLEVDTGSNSNVPPSGQQVPDRWGKREIIFGATPVAFALPAQIPAPVAAQLIGGATAGLNGALQSALGTLGSGLAASAFGVNIGNARFWDRQAFVGLVTPAGAIMAGRQYTPAYEINATFDPLNTQSSLAAGQVAAVPAVIDIRQSNSVQYRIQTGGLTANFMAAAGEGSSSQGSFYGAMAQYKSGPFAIGLGYNTKKNELGQRSLRTQTLGLSMDVGPGKLSFLYNDVSDPNPSGLSALLSGLTNALNGQIIPGLRTQINAASNAAVPNSNLGTVLAAQIDTNSLVGMYKQAFVMDGQAMSIGYKLMTGPHTVYVAYNRFDDKTRFNADTDSYGAVYTYSLSKRTDFNVVMTHFNNKGLGQAAPGQAGFLGGFTAKAGEDSNNFAVGMRHRF